MLPFISTVGTFGQFEFDDFVDEFGTDGGTKVLFMTGLGSLLAFLFLTVFVFRGRLGRFNDIGGRRFGGGAGILFERGVFGFELGDLFERSFQL
jgi:hypothetical protein